MNRFDVERPRRRFYRDSERGVILGVCAGLADYFELPVWAVRIVAVVIAWYFPVPTVVAYLIAALLMNDKPLRYCGHAGERTFWRMHARRG
ncbi:MAG TPA: PspC domain-containing protein [Gammaproteobacteria bacterium]|nr:PspC domain-containing protein [Gammaproteobacteria bacterium]